MGGDAARDLVVGLRDGRDVAASLAAALDREPLLVDDPRAVADVLAGPVRSAVVAGGDTLTTSDLRAMAASAARAGIGLGFVHGWAGQRVAAAHAGAIAAPRVPAPESVLVWSAFAGLPAFRGSTPPTTVLTADAPDLTAELVAGHRLVCLESHGNGVDAPLSGGRLLCARRAALGLPATGRGSLPCLHGGPCIRVEDGDRDADGPAGRALQFDPTELRADVLVWSTCWGLLAADAAFDPATAIARHLAEAGRIAATLTTITSVRASPARLLSVTALLLDGRTVGEVAGVLNRAEPAATPWVVLGDPLRTAFPGPAPADAELFRIPLPDGVPAVTLTARDGPTPAVFLTGWPESGEAVGLRRRPVALTARPVAPDDDHLAALRALWRPRPGLAFASAFMRWARTTSYLTSTPESDDLERDVELALARQQQLTAHPHPHTVLSGTPAKLPRLLERERASWRALLARIADYFHGFVGESAGVFTHMYARYGTSAPVPWPDRCPYCGGWAAADEYRLPTAGTRRCAVHCVVCANIADLGDGQTATTVTGPGVVTAGTAAGYTVEVGPGGPPGDPVAFARLAVQRVPHAVAVTTERVELSAVDGDRLAAPASLLLGRETPPGRYFLLVTAVVDGEVSLGRRPVTVAAGRT